MPLDTPEAKAMKHERILMLDLSSEFNDEDTPDEEEQLKDIIREPIRSKEEKIETEKVLTKESISNEYNYDDLEIPTFLRKNR